MSVGLFFSLSNLLLLLRIITLRPLETPDKSSGLLSLSILIHLPLIIRLSPSISLGSCATHVYCPKQFEIRTLLWAHEFRLCVCVYAGLEFLQRSGRRAVAAVKMVIGRCYISQPPTAVCWQFSLCRPPRTWKRRKTDQVGQKREKLCNNKKAFSFLFLFFRFLRSAHNSSRLPGVRHKAPATVSSGDCFEKSSASRFLARLCHFFLSWFRSVELRLKVKRIFISFSGGSFSLLLLLLFFCRVKRGRKEETHLTRKSDHLVGWWSRGTRIISTRWRARKKREKKRWNGLRNRGHPRPSKRG